MTNTVFGTGSNLTVKLWSARTLYDFVSDSEMFGQMITSGVLRRLDQTQKDAGDSVTVPWLNRLTNPGFIGTASVTGNESSLVYQSDKLVIDELRQAISIPAPYTIDVQRVLMDLPEDSYRVLSEWHKVRALKSVLNQLAGNTATTITFDGFDYSGNARSELTGLNAALAPSTTSGITRQIWAGGYTTDQDVAADSTATMKLSHVLTCEKVAQTINPYIRPLSEMSEIKYHKYVHTQQYMDVQQDTTGPWQYRDIQQSLIKSGRGEGELARSFIFSQTRIFNTTHIPLGVNSSTSAAVANCRRAIFVGKDAGGLAFGKGFSDGNDTVAGFAVKTDFTDVGKWQRIAMTGIYGIKKLQFTSGGGTNDNGVIVVSTYSAV